jgi:hypothetical protein
MGPLELERRLQYEGAEKRGTMEPEKKAGRPEPPTSFETSSLPESQRALELLCLISRSLISLGDKLDDLGVLAQQEVDLLRRLVARSERSL